MFALKDERTLTAGQKVRVYRNLRNGLFSIQDYKTRLVCAYGDNFLLENVIFFISKGAQERSKREKKRNVHAYAVGEFNPMTAENTGEEITYNPFSHETFVVKDSQKPITSVERLFFMEKKIYKV